MIFEYLFTCLYICLTLFYGAWGWTQSFVHGKNKLYHWAMLNPFKWNPKWCYVNLIIVKFKFLWQSMVLSMVFLHVFIASGSISLRLIASHYSDEISARNKLREKRLTLVYSFTSPFALCREKEVMADHLSFGRGSISKSTVTPPWTGSRWSEQNMRQAVNFKGQYLMTYLSTEALPPKSQPPLEQHHLLTRI